MLEAKENQAKTFMNFYRFGFNGMEKTNEVYGEGNEYTTEFRQYDPRLGRWMSIDPEFKNFAWQSPYVAFDNCPLAKIDPLGNAPGDPDKITKAASNAVSAVKKADPAGCTPSRCNVGVSTAFTEITGSQELAGQRANQMGATMAKSDNFTEINVSEAQQAANNGEVVIASWVNPNPSSSGHVALVVPGEASMEGTWEGKKAKDIGGIPKVMDTGAGMRTEEQAVNYSFGKGKQSDVKFYKYTPKTSTATAGDAQKTASGAQKTASASTLPKPPGPKFEYNFDFKNNKLPSMPAPKEMHFEPAGASPGAWLRNNTNMGTGAHELGKWLWKQGF